MPYLIDGHNLIGKLPDITLGEPNDEAKLVIRLRGFAARTGKKCIVIFDSGLPGGRSPLSNQPVEVVFASSPRNADRLLIRRIEDMPDPRNWTLVSSDHAIQDVAKRRAMQIMTSDSFAPLLRLPKKPAKPDDKPLKDVYVSPAEVEEWLKLFGKKK
jgi:predicted RNA-binding protein with PIN domain